jgi:hypothetical protein
MRFVLANIFLFFVMSGILYYQYFFQGPVISTLASTASKIRSPAATPALLPMPLNARSLNEKRPVDLDWNYSLSCKNSEQSKGPSGDSAIPIRSNDSVILNLKKCQKEFPKDIVVENETNGFTASVFAFDTNHSKTDSIPLKKGKNVIVIKYQLAKTKKDPQIDVVERLSIER